MVGHCCLVAGVVYVCLCWFVCVSCVYVVDCCCLFVVGFPGCVCLVYVSRVFIWFQVIDCLVSLFVWCALVCVGLFVFDMFAVCDCLCLCVVIVYVCVCVVLVCLVLQVTGFCCVLLALCRYVGFCFGYVCLVILRDWRMLFDYSFVFVVLCLRVVVYYRCCLCCDYCHHCVCCVVVVLVFVFLCLAVVFVCLICFMFCLCLCSLCFVCFHL